MGDFDEGRVVYGDGGGGGNDDLGYGAGDVDAAVDATAEARFYDFLRSFSAQRNSTFGYRDQLRRRARLLREPWVAVDLADLRSFDETLAARLAARPAPLLARFEAAATRLAADEAEGGGGGAAAEEAEGQQQQQQQQAIQVLLRSGEEPLSLRALLAAHLSRLVTLHGIVVSASRVQAKPVTLTVQCRNCGHRKTLEAPPGLWVPQLPRQCENAGRGNQKTGVQCPLDPYFLVPGACTCVDHQVLKLQESPQSIPTGELPRTILLALDRALVGRAQPGSRVTIVGLYTVMPGGAGRGARERAGSQTIRVPYLRVVGMENDSEGGAGRSLQQLFKPEEESEFIALARSPTIHDTLLRSIAPAIYGHDDIKRAVLCQLFGGSVKFLSDGVKLRGDINVLLLGDPGTAKSQLLKFVEKAAPIGVYTSGKGSSAAGLTASVIRDGHTKEFYLEGGAMVLADGGIVCIDEFDKMNPNDRVAIHEAMEQQTISIAKAGITTILNSRTAVLAAANPVFGRYDETRDASDNIDFQTTILSRFDMIFLVRDRRDKEHDKTVAQHVMRIHFEQQQQQQPQHQGSTTAAAAGGGGGGGPLGVEKLKRYISYCRAKCAPRISDAASKKLEDYFVRVRDSTRHQRTEGGARPNKIPITVRQLEAIVRVSEALAKMSLQPVATELHVEEAIRLFNASTVDALNTGAISTPEMMSPELQAEVQNAEGMLQRMLPIGTAIPLQQVVRALSREGVSAVATRYAVDALVRRNEMEYRRQRHSIVRKQ